MIKELLEFDSYTCKKKPGNKEEYSTQCPWCGGKDRFIVWPLTDRWWCRQCDRKGDSIEYLKMTHNMTYREACERVGRSMAEAINRTKWDIKDINGNTIATHIRIDRIGQDKTFIWEIDGVSGLKGLQVKDLPLYGSELLIDKPEMIIITEGEKSADALRKEGYIALGTATGANKWPENMSYLKGIDYVLLWPDNDAIGKKHMNEIRKVLKGHKIESCMVCWSESPEKGDAIDFIRAKGDLRKLFNEARQQIEESDVKLIKEFTLKAYIMDMELFEGRRILAGLSTGFKRLDFDIGGWQRGLFHVICSRPSVGKTQFMLSSAQRSASSESKTLIFSLETVGWRIAARMAYLIAGINESEIKKRIYTGRITDEEKEESKDRLIEAYGEVDKLAILVGDTSGLTTEDIRRKIERTLSRHSIGAVFIDHLGKIQTKGNNLYEKTTSISKELASMAMEYDIPLIALSQMNRESEGDLRKDRRPRLADLRDSGAIEQDARIILGLYRDEYYTSEPPLPGLLQVLVLKNSEGEAHQTASLKFSTGTRQITDWPTAENARLQEYYKEKRWLLKKG